MNITKGPDQSFDSAPILGMASLVGLAYRQGDVASVWNYLLERYAADPADAAALMDMSIMLQTAGHRSKGLELQQKALRLTRCYQRPHGSGGGMKVLVFVSEGDFMANTPIEFLMEGSDATLYLYYVEAGTRDLRDAPQHDVAFAGVGECEANVPVLQNLDRLLQGWSRSVMNRPQRILTLKRDAVAAMFADEASIMAPPVARADRSSMERLARGEIELCALLPNGRFPILLRPYDLHAGEALEKMDRPEDIAPYLANHAEPQFYLSRFVEYAGADGLYRKQRIAFIEGRPFAGHLAVSKHWMVHYLNSGMPENETWRAEESAWMRDFDFDFAIRHAEAFEALYQKLGLDYFVIDCAETADGRLLLFEAHVAMILHAMDPVEVFPYKPPAMQKLFRAFQAALERRRARSLATAAE